MQRPKIEFSAGGVKAVVWEKQVQRDDGEGFTAYNIEIKCVYRDAGNQWQETHSFRLSDLPKVALVAEKAYAYLMLRERVPDEEGGYSAGAAPGGWEGAAPSQPGTSPARRPAPAREPPSPDGPLTEAQRKAIQNLARAAGMSDMDLVVLIQQEFARATLDELLQREAAAVIQMLQGK
jgi:hypothetical protein